MMRKLIVLILVGFAGCSSDRNDPSFDPIPGQPEKIRLSQQSSGDGNCFEVDMVDMTPARYFASISDLVWGDVSKVEVVLDRVLDYGKGKIVNVSQCEHGVASVILRVTLTDAHSLFNGVLGSTVFYVPEEMFEGWRSKPLYHHQGEWKPQVRGAPARIEANGLAWTRPDEGLQVGQRIVASLLQNDEGHLVTNRLPIYELFNDEYVAIGWDGNFVDRDRSSCFRFPAPMHQPFTSAQLQTAYAESGRDAHPFIFSLSPGLTVSTPICRTEQPPWEPTPTVDMGPN